ncbi:MAG: hypothetical protein IT323_13485 [Anaerolineae bacterium]|nr:hypothetical protein [Anaerolineae bacterium]
MARAIENTLNGVALDVQVDFGVTVQTWKEKPKFNIKREKYARVISTSSKIYRFVTRGTKVRRALMSPDFRPKTRNRWIGSNKGRGGVVFISKRLKLPGIKAREFEETIQAKWQKQMPKTFQRAIDAEVSRARR